MDRRKNHAIDLCRIASMVLVVLCHIIANYTFIPGHQFLGQIFNCSVFTFISISGYLYGGKTISAFYPWMRKRIRTICVPVAILVGAVVICRLICGIHDSGVTVVIYFLNLQGLGFLFPGFYRFFQEIPALGPLWFTTIIVLCYCMIPLLQLIRDHISGTLNFYFFIGICIVGLVIACGIAIAANVILFYFLTFAIGYAAGALKMESSTKASHFIVFSAIMVCFQFARLAVRAMYDGTMLYQVFVLASQMVLGIWIMAFFFVLERLFPVFCRKISDLRFVDYISHLSLYIFMTHYLFCNKDFNVFTVFENIWVASILFAALTFVSAYILNKLHKFVLLPFGAIAHPGKG